MFRLVGGSIGMDDNLFDTGMNSLLMVLASFRLHELLGRPVPLDPCSSTDGANVAAARTVPCRQQH